jgi:hypothetical protein
MILGKEVEKIKMPICGMSAFFPVESWDSPWYLVTPSPGYGFSPLSFEHEQLSPLIDYLMYIIQQQF